MSKQRILLLPGVGILYAKIFASEKRNVVGNADRRTSTTIVERALSLGASMAGIASVLFLSKTPSHMIRGTIEWPDNARAVLVLALVHAEADLERDWWIGKGGTPGNLALIRIAHEVTKVFSDEFAIDVTPLPYHVEKGGIFLKDAAVLAGLGVIGKNNLLITPEYGPRVRFRAMLLDRDLVPTGPKSFDPCTGCDMPCMRACPTRAFERGVYGAKACERQMKKDESNKTIVEKFRRKGVTGECIKYCRACELACPVGK